MSTSQQNNDDDMLKHDIDDADEYGEESVSGSASIPTSDDDTTEAVANVIGNEPEPGKPFSMAEEIEKDEMDRRGIEPKDFQ